MTAGPAAGKPLTLNDLPVPEHRDTAWRILHDHGKLIELDNGFAATRLDIVEAVMKNPEVFSSKEAFDSLGSPIPLDMRDQFIVWKDAILEMSDASSAGVPEASEEGMRKAGELFMYLASLVQERRGVAGEDILSQLLSAEGEDALTDNEAVGLCFLFILAGLDTVTDALGFGLERLARNPSRRQEIVDNPSVIPAAIEELVRLDPPAPFVPRVTTRETVLDGQVLPKGTRVTNLLAVANRGEGGRPAPYEIDFQRGDNPHVSFGVGVHRCLGSHLARLEMRIVYEEWHRLIPEYRIADGSTPKVKWPRGTIGLESLDLVIGK